MNYVIMFLSLVFFTAVSFGMEQDGTKMVLLNGRVLDYRTGKEIGRVARVNLAKENTTKIIIQIKQQEAVKLKSENYQ